MSLVNVETVLIFVCLFMPGFLYLKARGTIRATDKLDFSKSWYEAVGWGCIFFLFAAFLTFIYDYIFHFYHLAVFGIFLVLLPILFVLFSCLFYRISWVHDYVLLPDETAWDYVFAQRKPYWLIVHLKNGKVKAGLYGDKSYAASYPRKHDIYIEEEWEVTLTDAFVAPLPMSEGIWIPEGQIAYVKYFEYNLHKKPRLITRIILSLRCFVKELRPFCHKRIIKCIWKETKRCLAMRIIRGLMLVLRCKRHRQ